MAKTEEKNETFVGCLGTIVKARGVWVDGMGLGAIVGGNFVNANKLQ